MPLRNRGINLKDLCEHHSAEEVSDVIGLALREGEINFNDISFREIAEATLGETALTRLERQARGGGFQALSAEDVVEASDGVSSTAFSNITGQIMYSRTLTGFTAPAFVGERLMPIVPTEFYDGEKIAGITAPQGTALEVPEGGEYPSFGIGEDYINTPATVKTGFMIELTVEAVAKDRTGLILQRAGAVGARLAYNRECRMLDAVMDLNSAYRYNWKGTAYATFGTSGGWINDASSKPLTDWTSVEEVMVAMADVINPDQTDENEPIPFQLKKMLVMPYYNMTARRILGATEIRVNTASAVQTGISANPMAGQYEVVDSAIAYQRLIKSGVAAANAKKYWFSGDPMEAFNYMQAVPLTVDQAPPNSERMFTHDVLARYRARERGVPVCVNPRAWCRRYDS